MLTGSPPWSNISKNAKEVLWIVANTKSPPSYPSKASYICVNFLNMCFQIDEKKRATVNELLMSEFINCDIAYVSDDDIKYVEPYDEVFNVEDIPMTQFN